MGLLKRGVALTWENSLEYLEFVREHGILQFLNTWNRVKDVKDDELKWGDEIECSVMIVDHVLKKVQIALRGAEVSHNYF